MAMVQYITDAQGHKTAVILPIEDYEKMLQDLQFGKVDLGENSILVSKREFEFLQNFINKNLLLSVLNVSFEHLNLNDKQQKSIRSFLETLVKNFFPKYEFGNDSNNFKIKLIDEIIKDSLKSKGKDNKIVQRVRKETEDYVNKINKGVIEFQQEQDGSTYKLNFIEAIEKAIKDFTVETNISLSDITRLAEFSLREDISNEAEANELYVKLLNHIKKYLDQLPTKIKFYYSTASQASKYYQENTK